MFDDLFQKKPEYDENGQLVGYSQPKIVWVILALVVLYCFKDKLMKQKGGMAVVVAWEESWVFRISIISLVIMMSAPALWEWYQYLRDQYRLGRLRAVIAPMAATIFLLGVLVLL